MLSEASIRMAISGVTLRWRRCTYSGRSRVKTSSVTNKKRRLSSRPTARPRALRRQLAKLSQPAKSQMASAGSSTESGAAIWRWFTGRNDK